jgi:alkylation response protein AidB-like acyl-CoA dehydrogenase
MRVLAVLSEEQAMLKDMASEWVRDRMPVTAYRKLFAGAFPLGHDPEAYADMVQMGWAGILVPEDHGGVDFGYLSLGLVLEELGRTLAASPLISSALVTATALRLLGTDDQKARWLPGIADGSIVGTLALDEGARHAPLATALAATQQGTGWRLDGVKRPVPDGMASSLFIVAARTSGAPGDGDGLTLFLVEPTAPGLSRTALDQIDARSPALLTLDGVELAGDAVLGPVGGAGEALDRILDCGRAGLAAEMLGTATQAFETILDYLKTRVQFGQLIGSFQALQHRAGAMFGELQLLRSAVEAALAGLDAGDPAVPALVSLAKAMAGDTLQRISNEMIQLHGGIGMTHEHDAGLYLKRARVADQCYGNAAFHRERWGRLNGF